MILLLLLPRPALAESLTEGVGQVISGLDASALEDMLQGSDPFQATGGFKETLAAIARGEMTLDFEQAMALLSDHFFAAAKASLWRLTRLAAPAMIWGVLQRLSGKSGESGKAICLLIVCLFLTQDLSEHMALCRETVKKISSGMQGLFPMLLTMMAAVGGSAGSALMQPAVVAAASSMTGLMESVTLPLAIASAMLTMLCRLGEGIRLTRLADLALRAATWTLGICFTVFIGVITTRSVTAAAIDGVTLRTAKYALDNLIPIVGGLFADTVDTLLGSSLLVQGALGVTGLMLIAAWAMGPLCQTFAAAVMYKITAALLQPVSDGELGGCIHDFSRVLMLLFVIQLCTAAMFLMLIAQLISVSSMTMMLR